MCFRPAMKSRYIIYCMMDDRDSVDTWFSHLDEFDGDPKSGQHQVLFSPIRSASLSFLAVHGMILLESRGGRGRNIRLGLNVAVLRVHTHISRRLTFCDNY